MKLGTSLDPFSRLKPAVLIIHCIIKYTEKLYLEDASSLRPNL